MVKSPEVRPQSKRPHICFITTLPLQVNVFLRPHIEGLLEAVDVTIITNGHRDELLPSIRDRVKHYCVTIERPIRPVADLCALLRITQLLRRNRPDLVQSMMPKAGLLGMLASQLAGIRHRVHWFTGQVWQTAPEPLRTVLRSSDRLVARLATHTLVDSPSQRDYLFGERIAPRERMTVLAKGSVSGVDTPRRGAN
jgi:hypothetical protein